MGAECQRKGGKVEWEDPAIPKVMENQKNNLFWIPSGLLAGARLLSVGRSVRFRMASVIWFWAGSRPDSGPGGFLTVSQSFPDGFREGSRPVNSGWIPDGFRPVSDWFPDRYASVSQSVQSVLRETITYCNFAGGLVEAAWQLPRSESRIRSSFLCSLESNVFATGN